MIHHMLGIIWTAHLLLLLSVQVTPAKETQQSKIELRDRKYIDNILLSSEIIDGHSEDPTFRTTLEHLRRIFRDKIKPMQDDFHYESLPRYVITENDITAEPIILLLGPSGTGKTTLINYLLGIEQRVHRKKPGNGYFEVLSYGPTHRTMDGTMLTADQRKPFSWMQQFGFGFLEHLKATELPHPLLKYVTIVDTPGLVEKRRPNDRSYPFDTVMDRLIQRSDLILMVFDPTKIEGGKELETLFKQVRQKDSVLKVILNKADSVGTEELMRIYGALMWSLSTMTNATDHPRVFLGSFSSKQIANIDLEQLFLDEELQVLENIRDIVQNKVRNKIASLRHYAMQVKNHAIIVDSFASAYRRAKGFFFADPVLARRIVDNPNQYDVYKRAMSHAQINPYDLPDHQEYVDFFSEQPLEQQKRLKDFCYVLIGCPQVEKLNSAINVDLPKLFTRLQKKAPKANQAEDVLFVYEGKGRKKQHDSVRKPMNMEMMKLQRSKITLKVQDHPKTEPKPIKTIHAEPKRKVDYPKKMPEPREEPIEFRLPSEPEREEKKLTKEANASATPSDYSVLEKEILKPRVDETLSHEGPETEALKAKCPKYRKTCKLEDSQISVPKPAEIVYKCPKYRKHCNAEVPPKLPTAPKVDVHAQPKPVTKCPKYRKTCDATKPYKVEEQPIVQAVVEAPQAKCLLYRKSCSHATKTPKPIAKPSHEKPKKAKKACRKRPKANKPPKETKEQPAKQATDDCKLYRKSCEKGLPPIVIDSPRLTGMTKCPLYRKSCSPLQDIPITHPAIANRSNPETVQQATAVPANHCIKYRISCKKMLNEAIPTS